MGSQVSAIIVNVFMKWLHQLIASLSFGSAMWMMSSKGTTDKLIQHLNTIDPTGNIEFIHKAEKEGKIPFIGTLIICKHDRSIKLPVYREKPYTD